MTDVTRDQSPADRPPATTLSAPVVPSPAVTADTKAARRAVRAGAASFLLEIFDSYLPTVTLAPAIIYFEPDTLSSAARTTLFYVVFAVSLLARPLAAMLFGHIADAFSRRRSLFLAMLGSVIFTMATACLPGYAAWGWGAIVCLLLLRFVGGLFLGGVTVSATPMALENSASSKHGRTSAFVTVGYPLGAACVSIVTTIMLAGLPGTNIDSPFVQWGWRLPFAFGGILTLAFLVYIRKLPGSPPRARQAGEAPHRPLSEVMGRRHVRGLAQAILVYAGIWFAFEGASTATPGILVTYMKGSATVVSVALIIGNVALAGFYFVYGWLGQRFGIRRTLVATGLSNLVAGAGLYAVAMLIASSTGSIVAAMVPVCAAIIIATAQFPVAAVFTSAKFPKHLRASGYGLAYNASILIPSFYSFYMLGLRYLMPYAYTPVILIAVGGACTLAGALLSRGDEPGHAW
jgi:MFS family permease